MHISRERKYWGETFWESTQTGENVGASHRPDHELIDTLFCKLETSYQELLLVYSRNRPRLKKRTNIIKRHRIAVVDYLHLNLGDQIRVAALESRVNVWVINRGLLPASQN